MDELERENAGRLWKVPLVCLPFTRIKHFSNSSGCGLSIHISQVSGVYIPMIESRHSHQSEDRF